MPTEPTETPKLPELKACPFCGKTPKSYASQHPVGASAWVVECTNHPDNIWMMAWTEAEAIAAWNTRPAEPDGRPASLSEEGLREALAEATTALTFAHDLAGCVQAFGPVGDPEDPEAQDYAYTREQLSKDAWAVGIRARSALSRLAALKAEAHSKASGWQGMGKTLERAAGTLNFFSSATPPATQARIESALADIRTVLAALPAPSTEGR